MFSQPSCRPLAHAGSAPWWRHLPSRWGSGQRRASAVFGLLVALLATSSHALLIDNGLSQGELGAFAVDVLSGGETTQAELTARRLSSQDLVTGDVIYAYESWVDVGPPGEGFRLDGGENEPVFDPLDPGRVLSTGAFQGENGNLIRWEVRSSMPRGGSTLVNVYRFTADTGTLGPLRFFQYLDEDVGPPGEGFDDDVLAVRGSVATNDLELFTVDNVEVYGVSQSGAFSPAFGLINATFAGWAADVFDEVTPRIEGAGQTVSPTGEVQNLPELQHPELGPVRGPADAVSVLAWDVDPENTFAVIVTTLGGVPSILCGNGVTETEAGEGCDLGGVNGLPGVCCTEQCKLVAAGETCRPKSDGCDKEERCDGESPTCPQDSLAAAGTACRASAGVCDVTETCSGASAACPADAKSTAVCRASAGACDVAESCDGLSDACPADGFVSAGTVCRESAGVCDVAEACTGNAPACPADGFAGATLRCRDAAGECDVAESCSGAAAECPADARAPADQPCTDDADQCTRDVCDGTGISCTHPSSGACECGNGRVDPGEECDAGTTNGTAGSCCTNTCALRAAGEACRPAAGECDVAETCTGTSATCPADTLAPPTQSCRPAAGACDVAESCSGTSVDCPSDVLTAGGTVCRPAGGPCDQSETCTGESPTCPVDGFAPSTQVCRPAVGACDRTETCPGDAPACPEDAAQPDGEACDDGQFCTVGDRCEAGTCRSAGPRDCADESACTVDRCEEASRQCVHDSAPLEGTACDDGNACTEKDTCAAGTCGGRAKRCDDGDPCTADICAASGACEHPPLADGTSCDDEDGCTDASSCAAGVCVGTSRSCELRVIVPPGGVTTAAKLKVVCEGATPRSTCAATLVEAVESATQVARATAATHLSDAGTTRPSAVVPGPRLLAKPVRKTVNKKGRAKFVLRLNKTARKIRRTDGQVSGVLTSEVNEPSGTVRSRQDFLTFLRGRRKS